MEIAKQSIITQNADVEDSELSSYLEFQSDSQGQQFNGGTDINVKQLGIKLAQLNILNDLGEQTNLLDQQKNVEIGVNQDFPHKQSDMNLLDDDILNNNKRITIQDQKQAKPHQDDLSTSEFIFQTEQQDERPNTANLSQQCQLVQIDKQQFQKETRSIMNQSSLNIKQLLEQLDKPTKYQYEYQPIQINQRNFKKNIIMNDSQRFYSKRNNQNYRSGVFNQRINKRQYFDERQRNEQSPRYFQRQLYSQRPHNFHSRPANYNVGSYNPYSSYPSENIFFNDMIDSNMHYNHSNMYPQTYGNIYYSHLNQPYKQSNIFNRNYREIKRQIYPEQNFLFRNILINVKLSPNFMIIKNNVLLIPFTNDNFQDKNCSTVVKQLKYNIKQVYERQLQKLNQKSMKDGYVFSVKANGLEENFRAIYFLKAPQKSSGKLNYYLNDILKHAVKNTFKLIDQHKQSTILIPDFQWSCLDKRQICQNLISSICKQVNQFRNDYKCEYLKKITISVQNCNNFQIFRKVLSTYSSQKL